MEILNLKSPLTVELTLTEQCNHKCRHCYNAWRDKGGNKTFSYEQIDLICKELIKNEVLSVVITGGEPTTQFDLLIYTINALKQLDIEVSINSNITLLQQHHILELKKIGIDHVLTSLPSIYESRFEYITQTKGSFSKFITNLKMLNEHGIDTTVNIVVSQNNADEMRFIKQFIKLHNIKGVALSLVIPPNYDMDNEVYKLNNDIIINVANTLIDIERELGVYVNSLTPLPLCILQDANKYHKLISATCCAAITVCTINADGKIQACSHETISYGNIFTDGLKTCWNKMSERRKGNDLNPECKDCKYIGLCGGECRMLSSTYSRNGYKLDRNAPIIFKSETVPTLCKDTTYSVNPNILLRKEDFGACVHIAYKDFFVSNNIVTLYEIMKDMRTFRLYDLQPYVEVDEHLYSTIYYMKKIEMITEE